MIQLHLLDLAQQQLPNLKLDNEEAIIKVEKILKSESKLDPKIRINDIENLIVFLRGSGGKFIPILQNKHVRKILDAKGETINYAPFNTTGITEETLVQFGETFAPNTLEYLRQCIRIGAWFSLRSVFINYSFLINEAIVSEIFHVLSLKNESVVTAIRNDQYMDFVNKNPYCKDAGYYSMLSTLDAFYFDDDILNINNIVCEKQKTTINKRKYLGNILYAATYFEASTDSLKTTLENNQQIALQWTNPYSEASTSSSSAWSIVIYIVIAVIVIGVIFVVSPGSAGIAGMVILLISRLVHAASK